MKKVKSDWSWLPEAKKAKKLGFRIVLTNHRTISWFHVYAVKGKIFIPLGSIPRFFSETNFRLDWFEKL